MQQHIKILGILFIVRGVMLIMIGILTLFLSLGWGVVIDSPQIFHIFMIIVSIIAIHSFATGVPCLIAGGGILSGKRWSRILGIIVAVIELFAVPLGTALGIYALWVLTKEESEKLLNR